MWKKVFLLFLISILSLNVFCQVDWTINPDPVLEPGPAGSWDQAGVWMPSVLLVDDTLRMWYSGVSDYSTWTWAIGYATSTDGGMTWTKYGQNPVLEAGPAGSWDEMWVWYAKVFYHESTYHMWYIGRKSTDPPETYGYATSPDGIHWTKYERNPIDLSGGAPGGVLFKDDLYHMWHIYRGAGELRGTAYSTSDDGSNWTQYEGNPVMNCGPSGSWDYPRAQPNSVIFDGQKFHLWYSGGEAGSWQIGYATSPDGFDWIKYEGNPVIPKGSPGSLGDEFTFFPSVIFDDSESLYKMWYQAEPGGIAYAEAPLDTSTTGISSTRSDCKFIFYPNPVDKLLTVEMESQGVHTIEITTLNGQLLFNGEMEGTTHQFDLSFFQNGVYFITVRSNDLITTRKIIKM